MNRSPTPDPGRYGPIEVFRAGSFVDMTGTTQTITDANLREIASGYDSALHPAPVVIGHPATDAPAYGWVEHLYVEGGVLKATLDDTAPEFADMVKTGRYKRVSISLFLPKSPANPKPGTMYLKHVGFLGATPPAVPGLKPVKFAGGAAGSITLDQDAPAPAFAEGDELSRLRREVRGTQLDKLIKEGRVLPVFKADLLAFAASLDDRETVSFSDGAEQTRLSWFMDYLAKQPKVVSFGAMDLGPAPFDAPAPRRPAHNVPDGYQVDRAHEDLFFAAQQLAREKGIPFVEAVELSLEGRQ